MEEECSRRGNSICRGLQVEKRKMTQRKRNNSVWEDSSGPSPSRTGKSSPATASGALALGFLPSPAAAEGASPRSGGGLPPSSVQVTRAPPPPPPGSAPWGPISGCFQQQPRPCSLEASVLSGSLQGWGRQVQGVPLCPAWGGVGNPGPQAKSSAACLCQEGFTGNSLTLSLTGLLPLFLCYNRREWLPGRL